MHSITKLCAAAMLASTSNAALASDNDARIHALENQIQELSKQIQALKTSEAQQQAAVEQQQAEVRQQQTEVHQQAAEVKELQAKAPKPSITNGRLSIASSDGAFTAAVRALLQLDAGYYMQSEQASALPTAYGPNLSSGANMRRVFLGLQGKVFNDWSYYFLYDFGGATTETPGHILYAYAQYDGFAPWAFRVGAYAPPVNIEDSTASSDLMFFERNSPSNLARNIAGAEGRDAVSIIYAGDRMFGALSLSGNKISDGAKAYGAAGATPVANYGEQASLLGRFSYLPISTEDAHWLVGVNGTYVMTLANLVRKNGDTLASVPGATPKNQIKLGDLPEIAIDSNGVNLVNTGDLPADHVSQWGIETAGNWKNVYGQAGYYSYQVHRTPVAYTVFSNLDVSAPDVVHPSSNTFSGWYLQGSWILTGESKTYSKATAAFGAPVPSKPFSLKDGNWGAFELAARFSDLNLNSHSLDTSHLLTTWSSVEGGGVNKSYTYYNTVRGGDQKILSLAANWYPNADIRIALDYQYINVNRLQAPGAVPAADAPVLPTAKGGQTAHTIALRLQLSL